MYSYAETYEVQPGDTLKKVARKFGHENPGPLVYFPSNRTLFEGKKPLRLESGMCLEIPYRMKDLILLEQVHGVMTKLLDRLVSKALRQLDNQILDVRHLSEILGLALRILECMVELTASQGELGTIGASESPRTKLLRNQLIQLKKLEQGKRKLSSSFDLYVRNQSTSLMVRWGLDLWKRLWDILYQDKHVNFLGNPSHLTNQTREALMRAHDLTMKELIRESTIVRTQKHSGFYLLRV